MVYARIVLPLAIHPLTYNSGGVELRPGMAVMVSIGPRKLCQGIVWDVSDIDPRFRTKAVESVLYDQPLLDERQMRLWEWVASYYMCSLGEVMAAAIPSKLRPEGFSHEEFAAERFRLRTVRHVGLHPSITDIDQLNSIMEGFGRAKAQYGAMVELIAALGNVAQDQNEIFRCNTTVACSTLNASMLLFKKLADKGFVTIEDTELGSEVSHMLPATLPVLTEAQIIAAGQVRKALEENSTVLLHGVTNSGKTEIFINLAAETIAQGKSVLYLLPEIPISWQIIERLEQIFGDRLVACHSKFTPRRRAEIFMELSRKDAEPRIVVGTRISLFLPLQHLGLIVVDEEHDTSFKQDVPAPRFHARDCAIMLAGLHGAKTLLGSATPSLESYYNALSGKYGLVRLTERYGEAPMPKIFISDSLRAVKRGERNKHFNLLLTDKLSESLASGAQAIIFQNRRGFSPYVECGGCSWVAHCPDCNVTLTLHKSEGRLKCHYCGHAVAVPRLCPSCGQGELLPRGFGTEKIEDEMALIYPAARIDRLDSDTAASPVVTRRIISDFEEGRTDILIGTQMVTKGFDFKGVKLVGVVNADNLLNYPDFRASERAFQMLTQAAGRAGRRDVQGEVVIQTSQADHPLLRYVERGDYDAMAREELAQRHTFFYPPYCRLISITLKHRDKALCEAAAGMLASELRPVFGRRVLGPEPPAVDRVMGEHIRLLMIKIERDKSFSQAKQLLASHLEAIARHPDYRKVAVICNVDPQ